MRIYDVKSLTLLREEDISYDGHWIEQGDRGFDVIQNGNGYTIFFAAYQNGSKNECPFGVDPGTTIKVSTGGSFDKTTCSNAVESKHVLNLIEFLYDA